MFDTLCYREISAGAEDLEISNAVPLVSTREENQLNFNFILNEIRRYRDKTY